MFSLFILGECWVNSKFTPHGTERHNMISTSAVLAAGGSATLVILASKMFDKKKAFKAKARKVFDAEARGAAMANELMNQMEVLNTYVNEDFLKLSSDTYKAIVMLGRSEDNHKTIAIAQRVVNEANGIVRQSMMTLATVLKALGNETQHYFRLVDSDLLISEIDFNYAIRDIEEQAHQMVGDSYDDSRLKRLVYQTGTNFSLAFQALQKMEEALKQVSPSMVEAVNWDSYGA